MEEKKWSTVDGQQLTAICVRGLGSAVDRGLLAVDKFFFQIVNSQQTTAIWNSTKVSCSQHILGNPGSAVDRGLSTVDRLFRIIHQWLQQI
jgi:hypothetical protein